MGSFSMNKVLGSIKKKPTFGSGARGGAQATPEIPQGGPPEEVAAGCVKQFCFSVGSKTGDDVTFLPPIVEAAVASPAAAEECARLIRKFMSRDYWTKASCQYNAIMLARILADNPGPGFTKYFDKKFVDTTKELLRSGRDGSVRQILMETLDTFENTKAYDENLAPLIEMWRKEKEKAYRAYGGVPVMQAPPTLVNPPFWPQQPGQAPQQGYYPPSHHKRLPDPVELANRLEEARTSAKLLEQVVACTPSSEVLANDLIKEFAERCTSAAKSIQTYMAAENPGPDNDTMESLIDTNEQLQQALNHHRRAVLQAKKQLSSSPTRNNNDDDDRSSTSSRMRQIQQRHQDNSQPSPLSRDRSLPPLPGNGKGKANLDLSFDIPSIAGPSRSATGTPGGRRDTDTDDDGQDPFRDPPEASKHVGGGDSPPRLSFEPYHPGFGGSGSGSGSRGGGVGGSSSAAGKRKDDGLEAVTPVSESASEQDVYSATPRRNEGK